MSVASVLLMTEWQMAACMNGDSRLIPFQQWKDTGQQSLMVLDLPAVQGVFTCVATVMVQVLPVLFPLFPSTGSQVEKLWVVGSGKPVLLANSSLFIPVLPHFNSCLLPC